MPTPGAGAPAVAVFDVNETLSDLSGLGTRLETLGAGPDILPRWFAATLRDGFALTAAGAHANFAAIGISNLASLLEPIAALATTPRQAAERVIGAMGELDLHPDVAPGLRELRDAGVRIVTLSNGDARVAESLLKRAGLRDLVEQCLSADDAGRWKPAGEAYVHAARQCGVEPGELALIAVHPWDIDGAARAGLRTGWLSRDGAPYPPFFLAPQASASDLVALARVLVRGPSAESQS